MSRLAVCPAPSLPVAKGWGGGRAGGVRPPVSLAQFSEDLSKSVAMEPTTPTPPGRGLELGVSVLSSPPTPPSIPALQPRSCIALWRPSSETGQARRWQGAAHGEVAQSSGSYPATGSCSQRQKRGDRDLQSDSRSSLTTEALTSGHVYLPTSRQPPRWVSGYSMVVRGRLLGKILHPFGGLLLPLPSAPS